MKCSNCGEIVDECVHCGRAFHVGDSIICYDTGVTYVHYCSMSCLKADMIQHKTTASVIDRGMD